MMEFFLAPYKFLRFEMILLNGEDMVVEDRIKMGQKWVWNNGCCRRIVLERRLHQPSSYF